MKKVVAILFVLSVMLVPSALAGGSDVTKSAYSGQGAKTQGVLGVSSTQKVSTPAKAAATPVATTPQLPFTGADLGLVTVAALGLVGMGFALRRLSRRNDT